MCAIFGIYNIKGDSEFSDIKVKVALNEMSYRGPDANELKYFKNAVLAHLRLSIIDLSKDNNQPFQIDNRYWIVFNGEIYNFLELKNELTLLGCTFRTSGDTEVLIRAYQVWGKNCVNRFNGMWAFAIYDLSNGSLFCSRDRFGVKPFNYSIINNQFIFSSEIKSILSFFPELKKPNYNVIANFCRTSVGAQNHETWFENIFRLPPSHNLFIQNGVVTIERYWDYPKKIDKTISFSDAVAKYKELFLDAVNIRMRSDVPVGFTLSSGIDSTSLVSVLKDQFNNNLNTYTASFSNSKFELIEKKNFNFDIEIDEPSIVKKLTNELNLNPNIIEINYDNYVVELERIIFHLESGNSSPAVFPLNQILKIASKDVTVIMEGQGADELLGGYISSVFPVYCIELFKRFNIEKLFHEIRNFKKIYSLKQAIILFFRQKNILSTNKLFYKISGIDSFFVGKIRKYTQIKDFPIKPRGFDSLVNEYLYEAHTGGLVNLLHYGDSISMANSLESRLPFMDYRIVEFVFKLPANYKIGSGKGKILHREAMEGIVPDYILKNQIKFGFESPLHEIFSRIDDKSPRSVLLSDKCISRGLFSKDKLINSFNLQINGKANYSRYFFRMLSVELWFRKFIDN